MAGAKMRIFKIAAVMVVASAFAAGPAYSQMSSKGNANDRAKATDKMSAEQRERQDKQIAVDRAYKETLEKTSGAEQKADPWATVRPAAPSNAKR